MTTSTRGAAKAPAVLVLEDGRIFRGRAYGAVGETFGEAVFSTGMTGYQETLTDPSYHRQVVVMTAPHIGNTGVNDEDAESGAHLGRRLRRTRPRARALQLALPALPGRRAGRPGRRRHQRHRHPRPHPPPARARRHARRHLLRRGAAPTRPRCSPGCRPRPQMKGADLSAEVATKETYVVPAIGDEAVHRRRHRPRHQGHDPAPDGRARHRGARPARHRHRRGRLRGRTPTACSSPTAPATRPPPTTRRASCARSWSAGRRCSASASATRSSAARSASAPTS